MFATITHLHQMGEAKQIPDEAPVAENANPQFTSVDLKVDDVPKDLEKVLSLPINFHAHIFFICSVYPY